MKASASYIAMLSALLGMTSGFHIPEGTPNGVYQVTTYANGTEEHVRIGGGLQQNTQAQVPHGLRARAPLSKRSWAQLACFSGENNNADLDHGNTDAANNELDAQCAGEGVAVDIGKDFYSIVDCTVAYACNFGTSPFTCRASDRQYASGRITQGCGAYKPGSISNFEDAGYLGAPLRQLGYGYEDYCSAQGSNFCSRGRVK